MRLRQKALQILQERGYPPEKHAGVPMIVACSDILLREFQFGFLREAADGKNREVAGSERFAHPLNITEACFWPGWGYTKYHHSPFFASYVECCTNDLAELLWLLNIMISGKYGH